MLSKSIPLDQEVNATLEQTFRAFTNATSMREWLCDVATVSPVTGGRLYLAWNSGFYACGEYIHLEAGKFIAFSWFGRGDPAPSRVDITLEEKGTGTVVKLVHGELGMGKEWDKTCQEIKQGWQTGLENLASVLETGEDLRITKRPMLGITLNDFTPEHAEKLGVPVTDGVRIDDAVEGMGAQAAGLMPSDVIVEMEGRKIQNFSDIPEALRNKRAGDRIDVEFYRGSEKMRVNMELSTRSIPEIPSSTQALAKILRQRYDELSAEITQFFHDVDASEADYRLSPDEWNVKEVLAHLIQGERFQQFYVAELVSGFERWADDFGGNLDASVRATVSAYPTLKELLEELQRSYNETVALFENLPQGFAENKGSFWRFALGALDAPYHFNSHLEQMRKSITAAGEG